MIMKLPTINYEHSSLGNAELLTYREKLNDEFARMQHDASSIYDDDRASINLPLDLQHLKQCQKLAAQYKGVSLIIVIGIGGSNLGTVAIQEAIFGKQHNLNPGKKPRILYADTVDPDNITTINILLEQELKKGKKALINTISKSGGTTETIANHELLLKTLQKYRKKDYKKYVVVTTDEHSPLWDFAKREGFNALPIPKKVGGRYSVLSPVGLFPLTLLGINTKALLDGAAHMRAQCLKEEHAQNPAMIRASLLAYARASGKNVADNFYFKTDLESIGKWYRQLMGESIGKEWNKEHNKQVWMGLTPTVSIGSTDLHSMAQLYFGGPNDKFFSIVTIEKNNDAVRVPDIHAYDALVNNVQNKKFSTIMGAISNGVMITLQKQQRPYCHISLPDASEHSIGALLQLHMMEMMYLAALLGVNAFDQPNVEAYKIETKKILAEK